MDVVEVILNSLMDFGITFYNLLVSPITVFLNLYSSSFSQFLLDLIEFLGFSDFFANVSFGSFFLGTGILTILVVTIIRWFIP